MYTSTTNTEYIIKPTKAQIVQRLLENEQINAEEAVILLMSEKEYVSIPNPYSPPYHPFSPPTYPIWYVTPTTGGTVK